MPARVNFGSIGVHLTAGGDPADLTPADETPFRLLVVGDFGGKARGTGRPVRVDRDNFDTLPGTLGVAVRLPGFGPGDWALPVAELDDFTPDRLWESVPAFDELRKLRRRLQKPDTFPAAAAEVAAWSGHGVTGHPESGHGVTGPQPTEPPNLLEQLLGKPVSQVAAPAGGEMGEFIRRTAAKYAVPADDPRQGDLTRRVDAAAGGLMRDLLHHPRFQQIEAAWRGLAFLVRRLDTDEAVHLYLLDLGRDELAADLGRDDLARSNLYDVLARRELETPGGMPWALVAGDYTFGPAAADAELLGRVGTVVGRAGAAFVAAASPRLVGCDSFAAAPDPADWAAPPADDAWRALRGLPAAARLGLALPRFLLRVPYGRGTRTVEGFDFEEAPAGHEEYLWGNPAFAWAGLLGEAFEQGRWNLRSALGLTVADLPLAVVERGGAKEAVPSAEALLTDAAADRIAAAGLSPLRSVRGANRAEFAALVSLAGGPLAGRWR